MIFKYTIPRLIRRFMPARLFKFMLQRSWIVRAGLETRIPRTAFERYQKVLSEAGQTIQGKRILVFGFGGNFALGCELLQAGTAHVVLCDPYATPDEQRNKALLPHFSKFLEQTGSHISPRPEYIDWLKADIRQLAEQDSFLPMDIVLSSSVFEHLDDVDGITQALASITHPDGVHLHFVDLRDHFAKYPFQMLTYSEEYWRRWLNPPSNLNRKRIPDLHRSFEANFSETQIAITDQNPAAFNRIRSKIQPQFLTGDDQIDAATEIQILAFHPRQQSGSHYRSLKHLPEQSPNS